MTNRTSGDNSPITIGDENKIKLKLNSTIKYFAGGFILAVCASLLANWLYTILSQIK